MGALSDLIQDPVKRRAGVDDSVRAIDAEGAGRAVTSPPNRNACTPRSPKLGQVRRKAMYHRFRLHRMLSGLSLSF